MDKVLKRWAVLYTLPILIGCQGKPEPSATNPPVRPVKLLTIKDVSSEKTQRMPGAVRASERVDLAFQVSGPLIEFPVRKGQPIKQGDLIARIDPRDYETRLNNAMGTLAKAKARLEYAIAEHQRFAAVKEKEPGAISDSRLALKRAAEHVSRADMQSAQAAVEAAKDQLAYTRLHAPFSGVIAVKYVDNYQEVQAKQAIVSLQNTDTIEVLVDIPELLFAPIRSVQPRVHAEFASIPDQGFELTIKEFATQADSLTQTYQVVYIMPAPRGARILPGMTATVIFDLSEAALADSEIDIPATALFADTEGQPFIWVVDPGTMQVQRKFVTPGELSGSDRIRITSGLAFGDTIAVSGASKLRDGQIVRPFAELK